MTTPELRLQEIMECDATLPAQWPKERRGYIPVFTAPRQLSSLSYQLTSEEFAVLDAAAKRNGVSRGKFAYCVLMKFLGLPARGR